MKPDERKPESNPELSMRQVIDRAADAAWEQEQRDARAEDAKTYREAAATLHGLLASEPSYETRIALMLGVLTLEARADTLDGGDRVSVEIGDGVLDEAKDSITQPPGQVMGAYRARYGDLGGGSA